MRVMCFCWLMWYCFVLHFVAKCFDVAESDGCDVLRVGMGYERHIRLPRGRCLYSSWCVFDLV